MKSSNIGTCRLLSMKGQEWLYFDDQDHQKTTNKKKSAVETALRGKFKNMRKLGETPNLFG